VRVVIETIPTKDQRYVTCGDYWVDPDGTIQIRVSAELPNLMAHLVALHEYVEVLLTEHRGIKESDISAFDIDFEKRHENDSAEPGDDPAAPYVKEHCFATGIERLMCSELGISWEKYSEAVDNLPYEDINGQNSLPE
jgi:hypothetical protein